MVCCQTLCSYNTCTNFVLRPLGCNSHQLGGFEKQGGLMSCGRMCVYVCMCVYVYKMVSVSSASKLQSSDLCACKNKQLSSTIHVVLRVYVGNYFSLCVNVCLHIANLLPKYSHVSYAHFICGLQLRIPSIVIAEETVWITRLGTWHVSQVSLHLHKTLYGS